MNKQSTLIKNLITSLIGQGGSDIHLVRGIQPFLRINKDLVPFTQGGAVSKEDIQTLITAVLSPSQQERFAQQKQIDFSYVHETDVGTTRFRGSLYTERGAPALSFRHIPNVIPDIDTLGLPSLLKKIPQQSQGFFLVAGPTGHGKSTTAAAMLESVNKEERKHIITVEDPIEFIFSPKKSIVSQREIPNDVPSFKGGITSALRSDADILFVSEMRAYETMEAGMLAAGIGHFVLSTIHTNSATQTVNRIIDSFPKESQNQIRETLSQVLLGVLSMRLLPKVGGGLIPAYELLFNNSAVANLIRENRISDIENIIQTSLHDGMISLNQSLATLVRNGSVGLDDAHRYASKRGELERLLT